MVASTESRPSPARRLPGAAGTRGGAALGRAISASHLSWHFEPELTRRLRGAVSVRSIGPLRLARVRCNAWGGERTAADISANPEPYLTLVMPLQGTIVLRSQHTRVDVRKHELGIWDSALPMAFTIDGPRFEQLSVLVPQRLLRATRAACAASHCARVDRSNVLSELCVRHMTTLAHFLDTELRPYELSLGTLTISLFDALLSGLHRVQPDRERLLAEIHEYIECYLTEETLSARSIAEAFEISPRYVHKLFEPTGTSVRDWIIRRRLERSADDLLQSHDSVTTIAYKWGFKDLGHYSRAFRKRFRLPPSAYRSMSAGGT